MRSHSILFSSLRRVGLGLALAVGFGLGTELRAQRSPATIPDLDLKTNGEVIAMAQQPDGKIILAGNFSLVNGVLRKNLARLNANGSTDLTWNVPVNKPVIALKVVGPQLIISGSFNEVGGVTRNGLAKLDLASGAVDPAWAPALTASGLPVGNTGFAVAFESDGNWLYLGGVFTEINGVARSGLARLSLAGNGQLDAQWNPAPSGGRVVEGVTENVFGLLLANNQLYVAGTFQQIGGRAQVALARVALAGNGAVDPNWNPAVQGSDPEVAAPVLDGDQLIVAGIFTGIGGVARQSLARISVADATADPLWNPAPADPIAGRLVVDLAKVVENRVAIAGNFRTVGGRARLRVAVVSKAGAGEVDENWSASPNGRIATMLPVDGGLLTGGLFQRLGDSTALGLARLDALTGARDELYPAQIQNDGRVLSFVRQPDGRTIVGGDFWLVNGLPRRHLVRIDLQGQLDETWLPNPDRPVVALALSGSTLFAGGLFKEIGGLTRLRLAKLSTLEGPLVDPDWNPGANGGVLALATNGAELFVGGEFSQLGGAPRTALGKVSVFGAGAVDAAWRPDPTGPTEFFGFVKPRIYAIAADFPNLYVGGQFQEIGGLQRNNLARLRADGSGAVDSGWQCDLTILIIPGLSDFASVFSLALDGDELFAGGFFTEAGGDFHFNVAKIAAVDGSTDSSWSPSVDGPVGSITIRETSLVIGGAVSLDYNPQLADDDDLTAGRLFFAGDGFHQVNFGLRDNLAELTRDTGELTGFNPGADGGVFALQPRGADLFVGGSFSTIGGKARTGFAFLPIAKAPVISQDPRNLSGLVLVRNPANGPEITHFRITAVAGGSLLKSDGVTPILPGDFITTTEGSAGLRFQSSGVGLPSVSAVAALEASADGEGTEVATAAVILDRVLPVVRFSSATYSAPESANVVLVEVVKPAGVAATVKITTRDGSARDGVDYTGTSGTTISLSENETSRAVPIALTRDNQPESDENFLVSLEGISGASIADPATAVVAILDSDQVGNRGSLTLIQAPMPPAPPPANGQLHVVLQPEAARGQWRLQGESAWRNSGASVSGLIARTYLVEFRKVPGYAAPAPAVVSIPASGTRDLNVTYAAQPSAGVGTMTVILEPQSIAQNPDPALRARWRLAGETQWRDSGAALDVTAGPVAIEFQAIPGFDAPPNGDVLVAAGQVNSATFIYTVTSTSAGATPQPLAFAQMAEEPFCYNGQLQSELGEASGVAVQQHVVLTAAHVLFDDRALSYVATVRWRHQRYRDRFEPVSEVSRGWIIFNGYARQRAIDQSPGEGSLASHNEDVAAVYFRTFAARGGFGGYLASDAADNEWLLSARNKMLVGYPVAGFSSAAEDAGKLHASIPTNLQFANLLNRVFATDQVQGFAGNSGGPLYVQADSGTYYPAAVYLGGTSQTLVRAINGAVVDLINRGETAGSGGFNNVNGGPIDISQGFTATRFSLGQATCLLSPAAATSAGGAWRIQGQGTAYQASGTVLSLPEGNYVIEFQNVAGYLALASRPVTVNANQKTTISAVYRPPVTISVTALPTEGGTVTGGVFGRGLTAAAVARPALGYHFVNWTEGGIEKSRALRYTFPADVDRQLVANFAAGPFVKVKGSYYGFATLSSPAGLAPLQVSVTAASGLTAKFILNGKKYSTTGRFQLDGTFHKVIDSKSGLTLDLLIDLQDLSGEITGKLTLGGAEVAGLAASFNSFSKTTPTPLAGRYTFLLPPASPAAGLPGGVGFGALLVNANGTLSFAGSLGDSTKVSQASALIHGTQWPFFAAAYGNKGYLAGVVELLPSGGGNPGGTLQWLKPKVPADPFYSDGITTTVAAMGSHYRKPGKGEALLPFATGVLTIGPGGLSAPQSPHAFTLTSKNALRFIDRGVTCTFKLDTGLFSGAFPDGKPSRKFGGALLQTQRLVQGVSKGLGATDKVELKP